MTDYLDFKDVVNRWTVEETGQRLGQYLMNRLQPTTVNPEIFYEESTAIAYCKFLNEYVE